MGVVDSCINAYENDRLGRSGLVPSKMNEDKKTTSYIFYLSPNWGVCILYESARDVVSLYVFSELPY
jgi:hypothetical protein